MLRPVARALLSNPKAREQGISVLLVEPNVRAALGRGGAAQIDIHHAGSRYQNVNFRLVGYEK